jgi:hypothetical protein
VHGLQLQREQGPGEVRLKHCSDEDGMELNQEGGMMEKQHRSTIHEIAPIPSDFRLDLVLAIDLAPVSTLGRDLDLE